MLLRLQDGVCESKAKKKCKMLLRYCGPNIYNTLCNKTTPKVPEEMKYKEAMQVLKGNFDKKLDESLKN